ncbi:MAG: endo-1,4-beta-xylanase [Deltaproteobacteria bacterium]|nr:endo-1,4-beta-xylanase [Deltaproteobacteria bacterium]
MKHNCLSEGISFRGRVAAFALGLWILGGCGVADDIDAAGVDHDTTMDTVDLNDTTSTEPSSSGSETQTAPSDTDTPPSNDSATGADTHGNGGVDSDIIHDSGVAGDSAGHNGDTDTNGSTDPSGDTATDTTSPPDTFGDSDTVNATKVVIDADCADSATTLREAASCRTPPLKVGVGLEGSDFQDIQKAGIHFNTCFPRDYLTWQDVEPSEGDFTHWENIDAFMNSAAAEDLSFLGTALIWHTHLPAWLQQSTGRDRVLSLMKNRIEKTMAHVGDTIHVWDVVKDAIMTDADTGEGNPRMRPTVFYQEVGDDYIKQAFLMARDYADSNGWTNTGLYYSDYSLEAHNDKSHFARQMIEDLVTDGAPIDGVSLQMHLGPYHNIPTISEVAEQMAFYNGLGLDVRISEMDINRCANAISHQQQLELYHDITELCVQNPRCSSISVSALTDEIFFEWFFGPTSCTAATASAMLLDSNYNLKEAYYRVLTALKGQ